MPRLPDLTHTILLTPTCGNCGHALDYAIIKKLPVLHTGKDIILEHEYAVDPDQCPYCKTHFDSIKTKNIEYLDEF